MMTHAWRLVLVASALAALLVTACSGEAACAVGGRAWCENAMAALALQTTIDAAPSADRPDEVFIVAGGFAVDPARYSVTSVRALAADELQRTIAANAADKTIALISDIQVTSVPGPGNTAAQGAATVTIYRGGQPLLTQTVHGKLVGTTWVLDTGG
jgi:hypothetical protein